MISSLPDLASRRHVELLGKPPNVNKHFGSLNYETRLVLTPGAKTVLIGPGNVKILSSVVCEQQRRRPVSELCSLNSAFVVHLLESIVTNLLQAKFPYSDWSLLLSRLFLV